MRRCQWRKNCRFLISGVLGPEGLRAQSQFAMCNVISASAPAYAELKNEITMISGAFGSMQSVSDALARLAALESHVGQFHIWAKQPARAIYQSVSRAWQNGESDSDEFFIWFRDNVLQLPASSLDPYLAQVVVGMRTSRGELRFEGEGRKSRDLALLSNREICHLVVQRARHLRRADVKGTTAVVPVYPPGEVRKAGRTFDALKRTVSRNLAASMDGDSFLNELEELFSPNPLENDTVMRASVIEACTREDFERVFRKVGLSRKLARLTARVTSGRAAWLDDPVAAKVIRDRESAIIQAMREDRLFGRLF